MDLNSSNGASGAFADSDPFKGLIAQTPVSCEGPPKTLVLGSGTSTGVPLIGCKCPVCSSADPRDRRMRSSVYLTCRGFALLVDASTDFRWQALRFGLPRIDAVLVTHSHADHIFGLDEIRRYNTIQKSGIKLYARDFTLSVLRSIFGYVEQKHSASNGTYRPDIKFVEINDEPFELGPFRIVSFVVPHGPVMSTGYRFDAEGASFVYVPDCHGVTPRFAKLARKADVAMLDGLRPSPHSSHLSIETSVSVLRELEVRRGFFTHIGHDVTHKELEKIYSGSIRPAYDGLIVDWKAHG